MDDRQLFKFAFLMECARDGLSDREIADRITDLDRALTAPLEKRAIVADVANAIQAVLSGGKSVLKGAVLPIAVGGSVAAGAAVGGIAAKLRETPFDADAAKKQELIATYNSFADQARDDAERRRHGNVLRLPIS